MKILILSLSLLMAKPDSVYICTGKYSTAYHKLTQCEGLKNCKGNEIKVSLADAVNKYYRKPCGYCER